MNTVAIAALFCAFLTGAPSVTGHVVDSAGASIAGARVFLEPGLGRALFETRSGPDGSYLFDQIPPGFAGVFAYAEGRSFGGASVDVPGEGAVSDVDIRLAMPGAVEGRVLGRKEHPIEGAQVTRVLLEVDPKVSIPLATLAAMGFPAVKSDAEGHFVVPFLPNGASVALKVGHVEYAQKAESGLAVGRTDVVVRLQPGVLVRGRVVSKDGDLPLVQAAVLAKSALPPHDTAVTYSDHMGAFSLRLNPGVYGCRATGGAYQSAGWQRLEVSGVEPMQRLTLRVSGLGQIEGEVRDAASGGPVKGARLELVAAGRRAEITNTDEAGEYRFQTTEGDNVVRLLEAPGFQPPVQPMMPVPVVEGETASLRPFWLAPIPTFRLQVVDGEGQAVSDAVVSILRPPRFGWTVADDEGRVELAFTQLPKDGIIVGKVEHVGRPLGAVFALGRDDAAGAQVELMPLAQVTGAVVNERGKPVEGAVVAGVFADETLAGEVVLWRTLSRKDGTFAWDGVAPRIPFQCVVASGGSIVVASERLMADVGEAKALAPLSAADAPKGKSLCGKTLKWYENPVQVGEIPDEAARASRRYVVAYCDAADAAMVVDVFKVAQKLLAPRGIGFAVVVDGPFSGEAGPIPVLKGSAPAAATTYITSPVGTVVLETFGMPPLRAVSSDVEVASESGSGAE